MKLVGFSGPIGAGKTWAARKVHKELGTAIFSFADPIKRACQAADPMRYADWQDYKTNHGGREIAYALGDALRAREPGFFVRRMHERLDAAQGLLSYALIDDVRLPEEVDLILARGGRVYLIEGQASGGHWIEQGLGDSPHVIHMANSTEAAEAAIRYLGEA